MLLHLTLTLALVLGTTPSTTSARETPGKKAQWAPSGSFSALHARAVFRGETESAAGAYARETSEVAAGSAIFLSRDSLEGSLNVAPSLHRYAYAHGNPLLHTDPSGHVVPVLVVLGIIVGFGIAVENHEDEGGGAALLGMAMPPFVALAGAAQAKSADDQVTSIYAEGNDGQANMSPTPEDRLREAEVRRTDGLVTAGVGVLGTLASPAFRKPSPQVVQPAASKAFTNWGGESLEAGGRSVAVETVAVESSATPATKALPVTPQPPLLAAGDAPAPKRTFYVAPDGTTFVRGSKPLEPTQGKGVLAPPPPHGQPPEPGSGPHYSGPERPWETGAEPFSLWTKTSGDGKVGVQNTAYDFQGNAVGQVDFKSHGPGAPPGHAHNFPPGKPASGHGPGSVHVNPANVPPDWSRLPPSVPPAQPVPPTPKKP